jgi:hypothetical protein
MEVRGRRCAGPEDLPMLTSPGPAIKLEISL